jgi:hypothetical protein
MDLGTIHQCFKQQSSSGGTGLLQPRAWHVCSTGSDDGNNESVIDFEPN